MNNLDLQAIALDSLIWVATPTVFVAWLHITFPLWSELPPGVLLLAACGLLVVAAQLSERFLPQDSPAWLWVVRGFQLGLGLIIGMVRLTQ